MSGNCPDPPRKPAVDDDMSLVTGTDRTVMVQALTELGPYRLTKLLGRGGMGEVWQAFDSNLERDVAVKLMRKELLANEEAVKRFAREARAVARLNHPNIVQVYAFGDQEGILYFIMELVEGETITQRMKRCGTVPLSESVFMLLQAIEGLSYANARGIIHRDIKPSNLMLTPDYRVKIADFGLAKMVEQDTQMTAAGTTMGSPNYMSPEQARGEEADHRSDIYALGISWYQMLTGELPFTAQTPLSVLLKQIQDPLPEPAVLKSLAEGKVLEVIKKMTAKDPEERYQTYGGLAAAISSIAPDVRVKGSHVATTSMPAPQPGALVGGAQGTDVLISGSDFTQTDAAPGPPLPPPPAGTEVAHTTTTPPAKPVDNRAPWLVAGAIVLVGLIGLGAYLYKTNRGDDYRVTGTDPRPQPNAVDSPPPPTPVAIATTVPTPAATAAAPTPIIIYATPTPLAAEPVPPQETPAVSIATYAPTPSPTPYAIAQLLLGPNMPQGAPVPVTTEVGQPLGTLPASGYAKFLRVVGAGQTARYEIEINGRLGYVAANQGRVEYVDPANAQATATPGAQAMLELIVPGAARGEIEVYGADRPGRPVQKLPMGTVVQQTGENENMYRILRPDGKEGWVLKVAARPKK